jgi:hypothetical protein
MKKIIFISIIMIFASTLSFGQANTLYFNKKVYQSNLLNPARLPKCKFVMGFPALNSFYFNVQHTGITYSDIFYEDLTKPTDERFLLNVENAYNKLNNVNYLFIHNKISLGYLALNINDWFVSFEINMNIQQNFGYPKSLFSLKDGNYFENDDFFSLTGFTEDFTVYAEESIGIGKEVIPGLYVGGKIKHYNGLLNFNTNQFQLDWKVSTADTGIYDYTFNTAFEFRASNPIALKAEYTDDMVSGVDYNVDELERDITEKIENMDIKGILGYLNKSTGWGLDLGVIYEIIPEIELSASILDLGYITWKDNPITIKTNPTKFVFSGFDASKYISNIDIAMNLTDQTIQDSIVGLVTDDLIDTLLFLSNPIIDTLKYRKAMNTTIHLGASFQPAKWFSLGFLYTGYFYHKKIVPSYTISSNLMWGRGWSYTISYTMFTSSFNNLGMGISYKIGPVQTFFVMENLAIPNFALRYVLNPDKPYNEGTGTKWIKNTSMFNFNFGVNLMFGCRDKRDVGVLD